MNWKILNWNCNGAFRKKYHLLNKIDADIFVIQECEDPSRSTMEYQNWFPNYIWKGANKNKGIAIFAKEHIRLDSMELCDKNLELFLPLMVNSSMILLAVWTKNSDEYPYIGQLWQYVNRHQSRLFRLPMILCGDFNSNAQWDKRGREWNHSNVVSFLKDHGMTSIYHVVSQETQGEESSPTFFLQKNIQKPYHIDYLFYSESCFDNETLSCQILFEKYWLAHSDHLPMIFTLKSL